jgi:hypothetical protein
MTLAAPGVNTTAIRSYRRGIGLPKIAVVLPLVWPLVSQIERAAGEVAGKNVICR